MVVSSVSMRVWYKPMTTLILALALAAPDTNEVWRMYDFGQWIYEHERQDSAWMARIETKLDTLLARRCGKE